MPRYVAFLRGVSPMNAKMPELKRCFEQAGFGNVKTVLASGNVVFDSRAGSELALARRIEAAMDKHLDRNFYTIVRSVDALRELIESDPYKAYRLSADAKRIVTFLREPRKPVPTLPAEVEGARILAVDGSEIFTAYVPQPGNPAFMRLIEKTFGAEITTRTWDTVKKCAAT
ncbi:DUF1697 domain-containing protein [Rudaea cellulosilytica]|uniref:DUF1697 domain-containing protein n=1 Tax=Rudaea cellulosilytica TaxID=540746 RepID=UPI00039ABBDA|nr:DUF1697 domain-containing protein [Rudaea cellulosilytica]